MICDSCHRPSRYELVVSSEVWELLCRGEYALCPLCMDERAAALGITAEGVLLFRGRAIKVIPPRWVERALTGWRPGQGTISAYGPVGNPLLYKEHIRAD